MVRSRSDLRLVEAKILWPCNGSLGRRRQVLPSCSPRLYLTIDALQHLQTNAPYYCILPPFHVCMREEGLAGHKQCEGGSLSCRSRASAGAYLRPAASA